MTTHLGRLNHLPEELVEKIFTIPKEFLSHSLRRMAFVELIGRIGIADVQLQTHNRNQKSHRWCRYVGGSHVPWRFSAGYDKEVLHTSMSTYLATLYMFPDPGWVVHTTQYTGPLTKKFLKLFLITRGAYRTFRVGEGYVELGMTSDGRPRDFFIIHTHTSYLRDSPKQVTQEQLLGRLGGRQCTFSGIVPAHHGVLPNNMTDPISLNVVDPTTAMYYKCNIVDGRVRRMYALDTMRDLMPGGQGTNPLTMEPVTWKNVLSSTRTDDRY